MSPVKNNKAADDDYSIVNVIFCWLFATVAVYVGIWHAFGWQAFTVIYAVAVIAQLPYIWEKAKETADSQFSQRSLLAFFTAFAVILGPSIVVVVAFGMAGWMANFTMDFYGTRRKKKETAKA